MWSVIAALAGCGASLPAGTTPGGPCPDGSPSAVAGPEVAVERWVEGTVVTTCADGPHAEAWPDGAPAARGARTGGRRSGRWIRWDREGRFDGAVEYGADGEVVRRREPSTDGGLVELELRAGRLVGWRPAAAEPQPEWEGGVQTLGTRYARGPGGP